LTNMKREPELTDAAWTKLQAALSQEVEQPQWKRWAEESADDQEQAAPLAEQAPRLTVAASVDDLAAAPVKETPMIKEPELLAAGFAVTTKESASLLLRACWLVLLRRLSEMRHWLPF
jgi:hypothetical protein